MFRSLIVPVNDSAPSDRGMAVAIALARRASLPVRLVTVCEPGADPTAAEAALRERATRALPVACTTTVRSDTNVENALLAAMAEEPTALTVMGTRARGAVGEAVLGSVAEALLARGNRPLLLVGPHVDVDRFPSLKRLFLAVDSRATAEALIPAVADWARCFGGQPWILQVQRPSREPVPVGLASDVVESAFVQRMSEDLARAGVDSEWDVLHDRNPADGLLDFTEGLGGGILVVGSRRWADPEHIHWFSVARKLVHSSPSPVLVLPLHRS